MTVQELIDELQKADKNAKVLIALDGSIHPTAPVEETGDYNEGNDTNEFFIVVDMEWS